MSKKPLSANATVVMALKGAILAGTYTVDSLLPAEEELTRRLAVSRVSLREGIKQLEALGWLRVERGNGTRVVRPDFRVMESTIDFLARFEHVRFRDLHELRSLVEVATVVQLAAAPPAGLVDRLRAANASIAALPDDPAGHVDADVRFHDLLLEAAPNPLFPLLMTGFRSYLLLSRRRSYAGRHAVADTVVAHERIVAAIAKRDPVAARTAMTSHLNVTASQLGF